MHAAACIGFCKNRSANSVHTTHVYLDDSVTFYLDLEAYSEFSQKLKTERALAVGDYMQLTPLPLMDSTSVTTLWFINSMGSIFYCKCDWYLAISE